MKKDERERLELAAANNDLDALRRLAKLSAREGNKPSQARAMMRLLERGDGFTFYSLGNLERGSMRLAPDISIDGLISAFEGQPLPVEVAGVHISCDLSRDILEAWARLCVLEEVASHMPEERARIEAMLDDTSTDRVRNCCEWLHNLDKYKPSSFHAFAFAVTWAVEVAAWQNAPAEEERSPAVAAGNMALMILRACNADDEAERVSDRIYRGLAILLLTPLLLEEASR